MMISPAGRDLIAEFEQGPSGGPALTSYLCPAGVWTIGYGHTRGVAQGDTLPGLAAAQMLLDDDLVEWADYTERAIGAAPTTQHEFDAMVSLTFNIGVAGFTNSTVLRLHKKGDKAGAARAFGMWNKATVNGRLVEMPGLTRRRAAETALYLTPDPLTETEPAPPPAMPQEVARPKGLMASKTVIAGGVSATAGAASLIDQLDQVVPIMRSVSSAGYSLQYMLKLSGVVLSVIALVAVGYMVWRYVGKKRRGEVT